MSTIEIDDQTAQAIKEAAQEIGVSVDEFLRIRVLGLTNETNRKTTAANDFDLDKEIDALTFSGPSLPADFSRADIYNDHD